MRKLLSISVAALLALTGCGGDSPIGPGESDPAPVLDFSPIAGEWTGSAVSNGGTEIFMSASLEESARQGEKVGDIEYMREPEASSVCDGSWNAEETDDPTFVVDEQIGGPCPGGTVTLRLRADGSLDYRFVPDNGNDDIVANGTLTRE